MITKEVTILSQFIYRFLIWCYYYIYIEKKILNFYIFPITCLIALPLTVLLQRNLAMQPYWRNRYIDKLVAKSDIFKGLILQFFFTILNAIN